MTGFLTDPAKARTRSLIAAIMGAAMSGCGFGLLMPLISLNLEAMTGSGAVVGMNAAAAAVSTLVATPFIPRLLNIIPARTTMTAALLIIAFGMLIFPAFPDVTIWWLTRFGIGLAVTIVFVSSETWINQLAKPERRASLLAVYAMVLSGGFGSGGLLLAVLGSQGWLPWIAGGIVFTLGSIPIAILKGPELVAPSRDESSLKAVLMTARYAPAAIMAGLIFGSLETGLFSLIPVYADRIGLSVTSIGLLAMSAAMGGIVLQWPLGDLADKIGRSRMLAYVAMASASLPLFILLAGDNQPSLFILVLLYGGIAGAFYTIGLALLGEKLQGGAIAAANAAFIFAYGLGSLVGPPAAGAAMDSWDPYGLMIVLSLTSALYLIMLLPRLAKRH